ncbi:MAG: hypothetical protein ACRCVT_11830 [Leadbetterella sp.]
MNDYRFGYIDGFVGGLPNGIPTGIGDLTITGVGMGVYFNMKPGFYNPSAPVEPCTTLQLDPLLVYTKNYQIPFGFKVMVELGNVTQTFKGKLSLDFALDRKYGINSISLWGSGEIGGDFKDLKSVAEVTKTLDDVRGIIGKNVDSYGNDPDKLAGIKPAENEASLVSTAAASAKAPDATTGQQYGKVSFNVGIMIDFPEKLFHARAQVYVYQKESGFLLTGIGPRGQVVDAVMHWKGTSEFYIRIGRPEKELRAGIKLLKGTRGPNNDFVEVGADAYFMLGQGVPYFPKPPANVLKAIPGLEAKINDKNTPANFGQLRSGAGMAVGASAWVDAQIVGKLNKFQGNAIAGFDLLVAKTTNSCFPAGETRTFGQLQIYAMAGAKVVTKKSNKVIHNTSVAFYLYGNGLAPLGGVLGVAVLGPRWEKRAKKGKKPGFINFNLRVGTVCFN